MSRFNQNQFVKAALAVLLAFVLVMSPVSHALAMSGTNTLDVSSTQLTAVILKAQGDHHSDKNISTGQLDCKKHSGKDDTDKPCCEMSCATFIHVDEFNLSNSTSVVVAAFASDQQELISRDMYGLKRPPRF